MKPLMRILILAAILAASMMSAFVARGEMTLPQSSYPCDSISVGEAEKSVGDEVTVADSDSVAATVSGKIHPAQAEYMAMKNYSAKDDPDRDWWHLLKKGYFNPKDTTVKYSRFMDLFCKVYNWGDRVFNTYDSTYVAGFGKNWKARLAFDAWADSYYINGQHKLPMLFHSEPYTSAAAYLHFMAVSVNYSVDLGHLFYNKPINHKKFEFGFTCARFSAELSFISNTGGTYIRKFGDYSKKLMREYFPGVKSNSINFAVYYYFNNKKYANGAAYNFSRLQKKSAGSFMLGFNFQHQDSQFDFTRLPEKLIPYYTWDQWRFRILYNEYCLLGGYGYNWVINKHLLYNITAMVSSGVTHCSELNADGATDMWALNTLGRMSLTYNLRDFFVCLIGKGNIQWYNSGSMTLFTGMATGSLSIGFRF